MDLDGSQLYRQTHEYYLFKLSAKNELGERTQEFVVNNFDSSKYCESRLTNFQIEYSLYDFSHFQYDPIKFTALRRQM